MVTYRACKAKGDFLLVLLGDVLGERGVHFVGCIAHWTVVVSPVLRVWEKETRHLNSLGRAEGRALPWMGIVFCSGRGVVDDSASSSCPERT